MSTARSRPPHPSRRRLRPRSGTEPMTARSDYPLRRVMSWWALALFTLGTIGCAIGAAAADNLREPWIIAAALCAAGVVLAAVDLVVIRRRTRSISRPER